MLKNKLLIIFFIINILLYFKIIIIYKLDFQLKNNENNEEIKNIEKNLRKIINYKLYENIHKYDKIEQPKISVVISVFNGEGYLRRTLYSIQNQDFKDIEIIMIDDGSKDKSVKLIKKLMNRDKRIKLYQNDYNKGALYTKANGMLKAKGKYVMLMDEDDMYVQEDAFTTIYNEIEKQNVDMLSFGLLMKFVNNGNEIFYKNFETPIIFQPEILNNMYNITDKNEVIRTGGILVNYIFKTELAVKSIKEIEDKYLNSKINFHDDLFIFFVIIRNACSLKRIKRIFYFVLIENNNSLDQLRLFRLNEKRKNNFNLVCFAFINYLEFLLNHTQNSFIDKKIASSELKTWYLNFKCKTNNSTRIIGNNLLYLYLNNKFIENKVKLEILDFLKSQKK